MTETERTPGTVIEAISIATLLKWMSWVILFATILGASVVAFSPGGAVRSGSASLSPLVRTTLVFLLALFGGAIALILGAISFELRLLSQFVETSERWQARLEARLKELAFNVEPAAGTRSPQSTLDQDVAQCRQAIRRGAWDDACALIQISVQTYPGHPEIWKLEEELRESRQAASREWLARIKAARDVNDPERVIELRAELKPLIDASELQVLDRDLAKWFLSVIHRRLRVGTVSPDLVALAVRVAGTLDSTLEGSSLRASLPTLRRAAGLCGRCGQAYTGVSESCPTCLSACSEREEPQFTVGDG